MLESLKNRLSEKLLWKLWRIKDAVSYSFIKILNLLGFNVYSISDFYSPIPVLSELKKNKARWSKPSQLVGITVNINEMKKLVSELATLYGDEFGKLDYQTESRKGFGRGFTEIDAEFVYFMIRYFKPKRYFEVGSGLSTHFASLAAQQNQLDGAKTKIDCIEPFPYQNLYRVPGITIIKNEVQDVEFDKFEELGAGDIFFIDSTHVVKIDGDVPYLYLEVLPRLKKGVIVHIHDIAFPYNTPYPTDSYIFNRKSKPWYFTEVMLLQAFLAFNDSYKILTSIPYIHFYDEKFLQNTLNNYHEIYHRMYPPCSIWLQKIK